MGWRVTVEPDGDGDVRIQLPITTDCAATGAICTEDGRKLSNSLDFTVAKEDEQEGDPPPNTPATGAPTISGTAQVGHTLTASTSGISDTDGLTNVSYNYQWLADGADISGATSSTYLLTSSEQGKAIKVTVSFTDDLGGVVKRVCSRSSLPGAGKRPSMRPLSWHNGSPPRATA